MRSDSLDSLFQALAHPARRKVLDLLREAPGMSVKALSSHFDMSRIGVMKHIKVLEACELVLSTKDGRTRSLFFNPIPIQQIYDRWTDQYSSFFSSQLVDLKTRVESAAQAKGNQSA